MMKKIKHTLIVVATLAFISSGCQKEEPIYGVNNVPLNLIETNKTKLKTTNQYVAILYANLFQTALSANEIVEIQKLVESIGDDQVAFEVLISNFMNEPDVILPTDSAMRQNTEYFITETYKRFLIRRPTEAEQTYFINKISTNNDITSELVYFSFALSDEYMYY